jgi:putative membrane protein
MLQLLPLLSTMFIVISAVFVALGWYHIARGNKEKHRSRMIIGAVFALIFFIVYMSRTIFLGNTAFGGPESVKIAYTVFLIFHIFLATTGGVFGIITLVLAFRRRISKHQKIGPWTSVIWLFTAITGVMVYLLLYVIYPPGETDSLFRAIFGF